MSGFDVFLTPEAQGDIRRLDPSVQARVLDRLEWMGKNADLMRHQTLRGEEWGGCFRYRLGDHRIIYLLDRATNKLMVLKVGHRRDVYR
jgi:mRNA interferase RelE/StbE